tara:strand:+ start:15599 stop:15946 length:348 start_codon:yes stop_codon:yes gene_type:complete
MPSPKSSKAKGRRLQNLVRDKLRAAFDSLLEEDDIKSQIMGMTGEDIVLSPAARKLIPYSIECKNVERLNVWKCIKQAEDNVQKDCNPALVIKRNQQSPYILIPLDEWISIIQKR